MDPVSVPPQPPVRPSLPPPPSPERRIRHPGPPPPPPTSRGASPGPAMGSEAEPPRTFRLPPGLRDLTPAQWIGSLGALLVAAAAVSLLTQQWSLMGNETRLIVMIAATAAVGVVSRVSRHVIPSTARALTLLAGLLAALDVGAIILTFGGGWPEAAIGCGLSGIALAELLRRRYASTALEVSPVLESLIVLAGCVAAGGIAAFTGFATAPLVATLSLIGIFYAPWRRVGDGWAALAIASPVLLLLDNARFTGMGTLRDLGLLDDIVGWAAPLAACIAAITLFARFAQTNLDRYLVAAGTGLLVSALASFDIYAPPAAWVGLTFAAVFVAIQAAAVAFEGATRLGTLSSQSARIADRTLGPLLLLVLGVASIAQAIDGQTDAVTTIASGLTGAGWLVGALRLRAKANLVLAATMSALMVLGMQSPVWAVGLIVLTTALAICVASWRQGDSDAVLGGLGAMVIGSWMITGDLVPQSSLFWLLPLAIAVLADAQMNRRPNNWAWTISLSALTLAAIGDHVYSNDALYINLLALLGATAAMIGAVRQQTPPLLLGTGMAVGAAGYQVLDYTVGVEGWSWIGLIGIALLSVAGVQEYVTLAKGEERTSRFAWLRRT